MATDVEVQFFSHLNGLTLGNNWGDLIRLLDKALVTGIDFTEITSASINEQGDVIIDLYAAHNAMLFQIVELSGFVPASLNQKYRIKGVPSATQLILKPKINIIERTVTTRGAGKLASLGYEIIFRDANDVKRVYRAKNPTAQHPFIRVDESLTSDTGSYTSSYAKYAMVGLLERMEHIDDYQNPNVLQLPFDPSDPAKNWEITGEGTSVVRGWSRWYWAATRTVSLTGTADTVAPQNLNRQFRLTGDHNAFYLVLPTRDADEGHSICLGAGLLENAIVSDIIPPWFLTTVLTQNAASKTFDYADTDGGCTPFVNATIGTSSRKSHLVPITNFNEINRLSKHVISTHLVPDAYSGRTNLYPNGDVSALTVPIISNGILRGTLKHIAYSGKTISSFNQKLSGSSMYLTVRIGSRATSGENCGYYFYLGELE